MPRIANGALKSLPSFPLPSIRSYLTFSTFIFISGFYYYYMVLKSANLASLFGNSTDDATPLTSTDIFALNTLDALKEVVNKHPLLFYVLLNTLCAVLVFAGRLVTELVIGPLSMQDEDNLRISFRETGLMKLIFTLFLSNNNVLEDYLTWLPWVITLCIVMALLNLMESRLVNPQYNTSSKAVRFKYLTTTGCCLAFSIFATVFLWTAENYDSNYRAIMLIDSWLLFARGFHFFQKMMVTMIRPSSDTFTHYMNSGYNIIVEVLDFSAVYYMYIYASHYQVFSCITLVIQCRLFIVSMVETVRKHVRHQRIVRHINETYPEANKEDLLKHDSCTICWELMDTARKLPCGHIFHEGCLRRWLQQDSSCAVCRTTLSLESSQVFRDQAVVEEEVSAAALFGMGMVRLVHWLQYGNRFRNELNPQQLETMVNQVANVFPQFNRSSITNAIRLTGSVDLAVNFLLENGNNVPPAENGNIAEDAPEESSVDSDEEGNLAPNAQDAVEAALASSAVNPTENETNTWFAQQRKRLIEECRRKYLDSARGDDLRVAAATKLTGEKKEL